VSVSRPVTEDRALPAGTRVTLTGTATGHPTFSAECDEVCIDRDMSPIACRVFPRSALTVVVPTEPVWAVGDAIRIDGATLMRCTSKIDPCWHGPSVRLDRTGDEVVSRAWSEGRVQVLYCQAQDEGGVPC
jgi:hypothetical protein